MRTARRQGEPGQHLPANVAGVHLPLGTRVVAGALGTSAVAHVVRPQVFAPLVPPWLGRPEPWVLGSGVIEAACAAGLVTGRRWAPAATTATLAVIWVGNLQMALDLQRGDRPAWQKAAGWARMPLQVPLMRAAWRSPTRGGLSPDRAPAHGQPRR